MKSPQSTWTGGPAGGGSSASFSVGASGAAADGPPPASPHHMRRSAQPMTTASSSAGRRRIDPSRTRLQVQFARTSPVSYLASSSASSRARVRCPGHVDHEAHVEVTCLATLARDAFAAKSELRAALRSGRDLHGDVAVERGDLHLRALDRLARGDGHLEVEVVAVAREERVRLDVDDEDRDRRSARRSATRAPCPAMRTRLPSAAPGGMRTVTGSAALGFGAGATCPRTADIEVDRELLLVVAPLHGTAPTRCATEEIGERIALAAGGCPPGTAPLKRSSRFTARRRSRRHRHETRRRRSPARPCHCLYARCFSGVEALAQRVLAELVVELALRRRRRRPRRRGSPP